MIASNKGGIPEAIDESVGMCVEPTAESFAKALDCLFENRQELEAKRKSCRDYAVKRFGLGNAEIILNSYEC